MNSDSEAHEIEYSVSVCNRFEPKQDDEEGFSVIQGNKQKKIYLGGSSFHTADFRGLSTDQKLDRMSQSSDTLKEVQTEQINQLKH